MDRLQLTFDAPDGRTRLAQRKITGKLIRVGRMHRGTENSLHARIQHIGPGLLPGDDLSLEVDLGENTRVYLSGQGATRLHPCHREGRSITSAITARLSPDANLVALWDPIIPFANTDSHQQTRLDLAPDSNIIWMETIAAGRVAHGEEFAFRRLRMQLSIRINRREMLCENACITPEQCTAATGWGRSKFLTSLYLASPQLPTLPWNDWDSKIARELAAHPVDWAITQPTPGLAVLRALAPTREASQAPALALANRVHTTIWDTPLPPERKY